MISTLERLRQRRDELEQKEGGFTLIELLIVVVILGILAAIVVFAVQNLTGQSATAACGSQVRTVETAMEAYKAQIGSYPSSATDTTGTQNPFTALTATAKGLDGSTDGPWLKEVPTNVGYVTKTTSGGTTTYSETVMSGSTTGPYVLYWDTTNNLVVVGTLKTNGATADNYSETITPAVPNASPQIAAPNTAADGTGFCSAA